MEPLTADKAQQNHHHHHHYLSTNVKYDSHSSWVGLSKVCRKEQSINAVIKLKIRNSHPDPDMHVTENKRPIY